jgi:hypothetical protein
MKVNENEIGQMCSRYRTAEKYFQNFIQRIRKEENVLEQWYSTFFVRVPPDTISLQLCTPKVVVT